MRNLIIATLVIYLSILQYSFAQQYEYYFDTETGGIETGLFNLRVDPDRAPIITNSGIRVFFEYYNGWSVDWSVNTENASQVLKGSAPGIGNIHQTGTGLLTALGRNQYNEEFSFLVPNENNIPIGIGVNELNSVDLFWVPFFSMVTEIMIDRYVQQTNLKNKRKEIAVDIHTELIWRDPDLFDLPVLNNLDSYLNWIQEFFTGETLSIIEGSIIKFSQRENLNFNVDRYLLNTVFEQIFSAACTKVTQSDLACSVAQATFDLYLELLSLNYDFAELSGINFQMPLKRRLICQEPLNEPTFFIEENSLTLTKNFYSLNANLHTGSDVDNYFFKLPDFSIQDILVTAGSNQSDLTITLQEIEISDGVYKFGNTKLFSVSKGGLHFITKFTGYGRIGEDDKIKVYRIIINRSNKNSCSDGSYTINLNLDRKPVLYGTQKNNGNSCYEIDLKDNVIQYNGNGTANLFLNLSGISDLEDYVASLISSSNEVVQVGFDNIIPNPSSVDDYNITFENIPCGLSYKLDLRRPLGQDQCVFEEYIDVLQECGASCNPIQIIDQEPKNGHVIQEGTDFTLSWLIDQSDLECRKEFKIRISDNENMYNASYTTLTSDFININNYGTGNLYWQLVAINNDGVRGEWTDVSLVSIENIRACIASDPSGVTDITSNSSILSWMNSINSESAILQYGTNNLFQFSQTLSPNIDYINLNNLSSDITYQWRIKSLCGTTESNWSRGPDFTTLKANQINANGDFYIRSEDINISENLCMGQNIEFDFQANYCGSSNQNFDVQFGIFYSSDPNLSSDDILLSDTKTAFGVEGSINGGCDQVEYSFNADLPLNISISNDNFIGYVIFAADYNQRFIENNEGNNFEIRSIEFDCTGCCNPNSHNFNPGVTNQTTCLWDQFCETCDDGILNGDEQDVDCGGTLCEPCPDCSPPNILPESNVNTTEIKLNWFSLDSSITNYIFSYKKFDAAIFTDITTNDQFVELNSLESGTQYCYKIKSICDNETVSSDIECIFTLSEVPGCINILAHNYDPESNIDDSSCETCFDNIMNGDEIDVDCGGTLCQPCPCSIDDYVLDRTLYDDFNIHVKRDILASKTILYSDIILAAGNSIQLNPGFEIQQTATFSAVIEECPNIMGCTNFDAHNYNPLANVDNDSCETCFDGILNGDEIEVDCGGAKCDPCDNECSNYNWIQIGTEVNGENFDDRFGFVSSLSSIGDVFIAGSYQNDSNGDLSGNARVFEEINGVWVQKGNSLTGEASSDRFGSTVSINATGDVIAVGAPRNDGNGTQSGHVRVFEWSGSSWTKRGTDIDGESSSDKLGSAICLNSSGSRLIAGSQFNDGNGVSSGHARIFEWTGTTWQQIGSDIDGTGPSNGLGNAVSMNSSGSIVAIGVSESQTGESYVQVYGYQNSIWQQVGSNIYGETAGDLFGTAIDLNSFGNVLTIGAELNDGNGLNSGSVRVFKWNGTEWDKIGQDVDGEVPGDRFGIAVSMNSNGDKFVAGGWANDGNGSSSGHIRIFEFDGSNWQQVGSDIDGVDASDEFGRSVNISASGNRVIGGAELNDNGAPRAGHVRVFELECILD